MFEDMHPSIMLATMAIFLAMIVILNRNLNVLFNYHC